MLTETEGQQHNPLWNISSTVDSSKLTQILTVHNNMIESQNTKVSPVPGGGGLDLEYCECKFSAYNPQGADPLSYSQTI
jgi:hypothetical protein